MINCERRLRENELANRRVSPQRHDYVEGDRKNLRGFVRLS